MAIKYNLRNKRWRMIRKEKLYLLLAVKSLSQNRRDKRYLLKIISLDNDRQCEVENAFEHGYEYVYKLWPCMSAQREFVKIQMLQCVGGQMVKRGQASPLVCYSQQGDRFQFAGSKQEQCVLILKFRVTTLEQVEKQLSSRELERLNNQVEIELIKNKHENQNYHSYLEYTNRFLDFLDNGKYLDTPIETDTMVSIKSIQKVPETDKFPKEDSNQLGEFNSRMRESLKILSNGRYFAQSLSPTNNDREGTVLPNIDEEDNGNQSIQEKLMKRQDSQKISTEIRKRRKRYTIAAQESRQDFYVEPILSKERKKQHSLSYQDIGSYKLPAPLQKKEEEETPPSSPIIRSHEFPLKEEKPETETSRRIARRRKKGQSENKQVKDSYVNALRRIQDVDLSKIFDRPRKDQKSEVRQTKVIKDIKDMKDMKEVKIQLFGLRMHLYKGDFELPKKLIITVDKNKYQTLPAIIKNKYTQWTNRLMISKIKTSAILNCKVVSVSEFSFFDEGDAKITVSELIRSDKKIKRLYLNDNKITIGFIQFQYKLSVYDNQEQTSIIKNSGKERKSVSLPQISNPIKTIQAGSMNQRIGTVSYSKKGYSQLRHAKPKERYTTSPDQQQEEQQQIAHVKNEKKSLLSRAKEKKLKIRVKIK